MKRLIKRIRILPILLLASAIIFSSCSDDDDNQSNTTELGYLGGWYLDWSTPGKVMWNEMNFHADGTFDYCTITTSLKEETALKEKATSTYTKNGNVLSCLYNWSYGSSSTEKLEITYLDKYTCTMVNQAYGVEESYSRIIDTYYLNVGDQTSFQYNDSEFEADTYTSSDEDIIKVSETGKMTAVKRGTTYVTARAAVGAVTIKVIVTDQQYATDEYGDDIGLSKEQVIKKYGENYLESKKNNCLLYYPGNRDISALTFYFNAHGYVKYVYAQYWQGTDFSKIIQSFDKKYNRIGKEENGFNSFYTSNTECTYYLFTDASTSLVGYQRVLDDFEKYDDCIIKTADQVAEDLGYELTAEDDGFFVTLVPYGQIYSSVMVSYDTESLMTQTMTFTCANGVSEEDMLNRVKKYYPAYLEGIGYCEKEDWWNLENRVFVNVSTNRKGHVQVRYTYF